MTLLELCDKLGATLIIKRLSMREGASVKYTVNIQSAKLSDKPDQPIWELHKVARIINPDVNVALNKLCNRISGNYITCGHREVYVEKVEKGKLSVLGVW